MKTFSKINLHIVFAVKFRDSVLSQEMRDELYPYIAAIIRNHGHIPVAVGGYYDHLHLLICSRPTVDIPELVKAIKLATNQLLQPKFRCRFAWQEGYGVFSVSPTHVDAVRNYIDHQSEHHDKVSLFDEYRRLLNVNKIDYKDEDLPHELM